MQGEELLMLSLPEESVLPRKKNQESDTPSYRGTDFKSQTARHLPAMDAPTKTQDSPTLADDLDCSNLQAKIRQLEKEVKTAREEKGEERNKFLRANLELQRERQIKALRDESAEKHRHLAQYLGTHVNEEEEIRNNWTRRKCHVLSHGNCQHLARRQASCVGRPGPQDAGPGTGVGAEYRALSRQQHILVQEPAPRLDLAYS